MELWPGMVRLRLEGRGLEKEGGLWDLLASLLGFLLIPGEPLEQEQLRSSELPYNRVHVITKAQNKQKANKLNR